MPRGLHAVDPEGEDLPADYSLPEVSQLWGVTVDALRKQIVRDALSVVPGTNPPRVPGAVVRERRAEILDRLDATERSMTDEDSTRLAEAEDRVRRLEAKMARLIAVNRSLLVALQEANAGLAAEIEATMNEDGA